MPIGCVATKKVPDVPALPRREVRNERRRCRGSADRDHRNAFRWPPFSFSERGVREDEGRLQLTFFYRGKRLRITVDQHGRIVGRSTIDFGERPLPAGLRRPP